MFKTHLVLGLFLGLVSLQFLNVPYKLLFVLLVASFSSLPDIDHPKSKLGRKLFFLSWPISLIFKHRGFFHSIFPPLFLFLFFNYVKLSFLAFAISIGYISHLIGDAITKEGINFLHPFANLRFQGPITTGGILERLIFFLLIFLDISYIFKLLI